MSLPDSDAGDEIQRLADALRPALLKVSRRLRREAQKVGVSPLDAQLLGLISKHPGLGAAELADREQVSRPSMSVHLKRLAAEGLIRREAQIGDGRRAGIRLTPAGEAALAAIRAHRNDWLAARLARLTPASRRALAAAAAPLLRLAEA